jgi:hypothetical protein
LGEAEACVIKEGVLREGRNNGMEGVEWRGIKRL